jgi:hypothetical protein
MAVIIFFGIFSLIVVPMSIFLYKCRRRISVIDKLEELYCDQCNKMENGPERQKTFQTITRLYAERCVIAKRCKWICWFWIVSIPIATIVFIVLCK